MSKFGNLCVRGEVKYGKMFDPTDLAPRFLRYFESGERIRVKLNSFGGIIKTGTVGVSTGHKPVFLLMYRKTDYGSPYTLSPKDEILNIVQPKRRKK